MYNLRPNLIIGFHGCDEEICNKLLNNPRNIEISKKPYDWLGNGLYFWENDRERALKWALDKQSRGLLKKASVIGAIINLGYFFDLLDSEYIEMLGIYHKLMASEYVASGIQLPQNKNAP